MLRHRTQNGSKVRTLQPLTGDCSGGGSVCILQRFLLLPECHGHAISLSLPDVRDVLCRFSGRPASYYSLAGTDEYQVKGMSDLADDESGYHAQG